MRGGEVSLGRGEVGVNEEVREWNELKESR